MSRALPPLLLLLGSGASLLLPGLGRAPAMETTDARYLEISREMYVSGDYLVPRLAGLRHLDKPPMAYWAGALGFALFGVGEFGGRFFAQIAVLATSALLFVYGRRWCGGVGALTAALVFLTSGLLFWSSRVLATDLFQLFFLTWAMFLLFEGTVGEGSITRTATGLGLLGASMLAKGPIALFAAMTVLLPFWILRRDRVRVRPQGVFLGALLFVAIGAPWYAFLVLRDPGLAHYFIDLQLRSRITAGGAGHSQGAWYYFLVWPAGLLPWTPLACLALWRLRPRGSGRASDPVDLYLLLWSIVPVLAFSLFSTKLPMYILPSFPAAALAIGRALSRGLFDGKGGARAVAAAGFSVAVAALAAAGIVGWSAITGTPWIRGLHASAFVRPGIYAIALLLLAPAAAFVAASLRSRVSLRKGILATGAAAGVLHVLSFNAVAPGVPRTHREASRIARTVPGARLVEHGRFLASPLFYTGAVDRLYLVNARPEVTFPEELRRLDRLTLRGDAVLDLLREGEPTFCITDRKDAERLERATASQRVSEGPQFVTLANPAALRALAERGIGPPLGDPRTGPALRPGR